MRPRLFGLGGLQVAGTAAIIAAVGLILAMSSTAIVLQTLELVPRGVLRRIPRLEPSRDVDRNGHEKHGDDGEGFRHGGRMSPAPWRTARRVSSPRQGLHPTISKHAPAGHAGFPG